MNDKCLWQTVEDVQPTAYTPWAGVTARVIWRDSWSDTVVCPKCDFTCYSEGEVNICDDCGSRMLSPEEEAHEINDLLRLMEYRDLYCEVVLGCHGRLHVAVRRNARTP